MDVVIAGNVIVDEYMKVIQTFKSIFNKNIIFYVIKSYEVYNKYKNIDVFILTSQVNTSFFIDELNAIWKEFKIKM